MFPVIMKFISFLFVLLVLLSGCRQKTIRDLLEKNPSYNVIFTFSKENRSATGLTLRRYGINYDLPKGYQYKNEIANYTLSFLLTKNKEDEVSLDEARNLLVNVAENFLKTVNSDQQVIPKLEIYPLTTDQLDITINFEDENRIYLGQGVATIYFWHGKIRYEGYKIREYTGKYPADGKHYIILEESYADALERVSIGR